VKEHGILFATAMVRAILAGQKSQTRRLLQAQSAEAADVWANNGDGTWSSGWRGDGGNLATLETVRAPHGPVGRRLWVRETWHQCPHCERTVSYRAGGWREAPSGAPDDAGDRCDDDTRPLSPKCEAHGWKPSIHMPRWASRITLEVTRVRVERVGDITMADVRAEGVQLPVAPAGNGKVWPLVNVLTPYEKKPLDGTWTEADYWRSAFACLWEEVNGKGSFASNPWVWVYDFRRVG